MATARKIPVPLPSGLNVADPVAGLPAGDCPILDNLIRDEFGLRTRRGSIDWCTGLDGEVRAILPYQGSDATEDRLFACTASGVWDVSASSSSPTRVYEFPEQDGESGWANGVVFQSAAERYLAACDESNGYVRYTESTHTWQRMTSSEVTGGADPATFAQVCSWKNLLWFTEKDSARAWYMPLGSTQGAATSWDYGRRMKYGGTLVGLWNWTIDGGAGIDDHLVAITTGGDVAVYQGTNPNSSSSFVNRGTWYCGTVPTGRRICSEAGGDLLVLTSSGLLPLSRLVAGADQLAADAYTTRKIAPLLARYMDARRSRFGWAVRQHPEDNALLILMPLLPGQTDEQLAMALATKGWARYQGLAMTCADTWRGTLFYGTPDGRVVRNTGWADGIGLNGSGATDIVGYAMTGFSHLGSPGNHKRVSMVKPDFVTDGTEPTYGVAARYDYDLSTPSRFSTVTGAPCGWDVGTWDGTLVWSDGTGTAGRWVGVSGMGKTAAIAIQVTSRAKTTLVGLTAMVEAGGGM